MLHSQMYTALHQAAFIARRGSLWPPAQWEWRLYSCSAQEQIHLKRSEQPESLGETPFGNSGVSQPDILLPQRPSALYVSLHHPGEREDLLAFNNFLSKKSSSFYSHSNCGCLHSR